MRYYTFPPSPKLAPYVRAYWVLEGTASPERPYIHRSTADGCAEMLFHYKGRFDELLQNGWQEKSFISGVHGPSQCYSRFLIHQDFGIFGAYLYPFALAQLLNISAAAVSNQMPDLHSLLGQEGKDLEEKIFLARNNAQRTQILNSFLEAQLTQYHQYQPPVFSAIRTIIDQRGLIKVAELAQQVFLSTRQFERKFKEFAGFSPKLYARIIRFQATTREYGNREKSLTEIAYDCGYYDQSHFIHDFKAFSGHHPRHYFSGKAEGTEWKDV